jgi:hypothetical protein
MMRNLNVVLGSRLADDGIVWWKTSSSTKPRYFPNIFNTARAEIENLALRMQGRDCVKGGDRPINLS